MISPRLLHGTGLQAHDRNQHVPQPVLPQEIFMHNVVTRDTRRSGMATLRVPGRITQSKPRWSCRRYAASRPGCRDQNRSKKNPEISIGARSASLLFLLQIPIYRSKHLWRDWSRNNESGNSRYQRHGCRRYEGVYFASSPRGDDAVGGIAFVAILAGRHPRSEATAPRHLPHSQT